MPVIIGGGIGEVTYDATTESVLDASQLSWSLLNDKLELLIDSRRLALLFLSPCFFGDAKCLPMFSCGSRLESASGKCRLQTRW